MKDRSSLTRRQLHALPFLISNPNIELAAKQAGISPKQIFDWLNQPAFRQELENRKNEAVDQAVERLKATASKACDTLIGLLDHAESESVRHRVAKANKIIGSSLKDNDAYLRYLWITSLDHSNHQVIYIPTEANIPILEAGKR